MSQGQLARRLGTRDAVFIGLGSMIGAGVFSAFAPRRCGGGLAVGADVALAAVNYRGVTRTAALTRIIVALVLGAVAVVASLTSDGVALGRVTDLGTGTGLYGVLQSAGLLFFAFAGYARIATMGEEIRDPARTIPRAIVLALGITVAVYAVVAVTLLAVLGADGVAGSTTPVASAVAAGGWGWAEPVVRVGAAVASLGALLALIAGIGRTGLAMARNGDLPGWLAAVHPTYQVPHHAEVALAVVVGVVVMVADLRGAIGFSSFGVLIYYLIANVSAYTQSGERRRFPRWLQAVGAVGCVVLVVTLPLSAVIPGVAVFVIGVVYRLWRLRRLRRRSPGLT